MQHVICKVTGEAGLFVQHKASQQVPKVIYI